MPLLLLCGIPGAGKTTIAKKISENLGAPYFSFDDFIETQLQQPSTASCFSNDICAHLPKPITDNKEEEDLLKPMKIYRKSWENSIEDYLNQLITMGVSNPFILLDDNFYLQSQRRDFVKIGKRFGLKICSVKVLVDVKEAQKRNLERNNCKTDKRMLPKRLWINSEIIKKMDQKFEDSGIDYFYNSASSATANIFTFIQNFQKTYPDNFSMTKTTVPDSQPEHDESAIQAIDLLSREITSRIIASGYQRRGKEINDIRREFVETFKKKKLYPNLTADIVKLYSYFYLSRLSRRLCDMASDQIIQPCCSTTSEEPTTNFIKCDSKELNLDVVLLNGQSFRWKKDNNNDESEKLIGVACHRVWKIWRIDENQIAFQVLAKFPQAKVFSGESKDDEEVLKDYFQLNVNLSTLYTDWQTLDPHFSSIFQSNDKKFEGIRILQQPLLETIFSFICSANNNISRISNMVNTLAELYGNKITVKMEKDEKIQDFYDFPSIEQMENGLNGMEKILREKGFGYRAKYIAKSVETLSKIDGGFKNWEKKLKEMEYGNAKIEIQKLDGVGPKVADCICLMALNQHHVVPVDTHVFQITALHYLPELKKSKSVTDVIYKRIILD
uniref:DNA-(apurinic or apyrimidinic site) lyase n=1 Tax=Panagrolaimus superbus TaxID=310955 RepID=A0A914XXA3_9BILA